MIFNLTAKLFKTSESYFLKSKFFLFYMHYPSLLKLPTFFLLLSLLQLFFGLLLLYSPSNCANWLVGR